MAAIASFVSTLPMAKREIKRWPWLGWLKKNRFFVGVFAIAVLAVLGVLAVVDAQREREPLLLTSGPTGLAPRASADALQREIEGVAKRDSADAISFFRSGDQFMEVREFAAAATAYKRSAEKIASKAAFTNLALSSRYSADLTTALDAARHAVAIPESSGTFGRVAHANALLQLGITLSDLGKRDEAGRHLVNAFNCFRGCSNEIGKGAVEYALAVFQYRGGRTAEALTLLSAARKRFAAQRDRAAEASVVNVMGVARLDMGATDDGLADLEQALALYREVGNLTGEAGALLNIGTGHQDKCQLAAAMVSFADSNAAAIRIHDRNIQALAKAGVAVTLIDQDNLTKAEQEARAAISIAEGTVTTEDDAWAHLALATVLRGRHRLSEAASEINLALPQFANLSAVGMLAATIEEARIATDAGQFAVAEELLRHTGRSATSTKFELYRTSIYIAEADLYRARGDEAKAAELLRLAKESSVQHRIQSCEAQSLDARLVTPLARPRPPR